MLVKEAKELIAASELSDTSLDRALKVFEGLDDGAELPVEAEMELMKIMDSDGSTEQLLSDPLEDIPIDK